MKKLLGIAFLLLFIFGKSFASEKKFSLFGVFIGDNINNYNFNKEKEIKPNAFLIEVPMPNSDFIKYFAGINRLNNKIVYIGGIHKKNFVLGSEHKNKEKLEEQWLKCSNELKEYVRIAANGKQFSDFIVREDSDFDDFKKLTRTIWLDKLKEFPFETQFAVGLDCGKYGAIESIDDKIGLRMELVLMDHRNLKQVIKDNEEFKNKKIDKTGLQ